MFVSLSAKSGIVHLSILTERKFARMTNIYDKLILHFKKALIIQYNPDKLRDSQNRGSLIC